MADRICFEAAAKKMWEPAKAAARDHGAEGAVGLVLAASEMIALFAERLEPTRGPTVWAAHRAFADAFQTFLDVAMACTCGDPACPARTPPTPRTGKPTAFKTSARKR